MQQSILEWPASPSSSLYTAVRDDIIRERKELGFSQEELADRAGVHRTYLGAAERGEVNISIDNIDRISAALGIAAASLLEIPGARDGQAPGPL